MRSLVEYLARALVDDPSQVDVQETAEGDSVVIKLKVAKSDLGKVIGKKGRTARALRTVLGAATLRTGKRYALEIVEPPAAPPPAPPAPAPAAA